ncbi:MAG: DUF4244 domain-containing protein [Acidimicrobiales bacterium]
MYLATEIYRQRPHRGRHANQRGQATAEYALVIVGAATIAGLVLAWAGSTGKITRLLNAVLDVVIGQVG